MFQEMLQGGSIDLPSIINSQMRKDVLSKNTSFTNVKIPCPIDKIRVLLAYGTFVAGDGITYTVDTCRVFDSNNNAVLINDSGTSRDEIKIENGNLFYRQKGTSLNKAINIVLLYES